RFHHAFDVLQYIMVPEPQHTIVVCLKIVGPQCVGCHVFGLIVLSAVDLNDKTSFMTGKVYKVRTNCCLSAKVSVLDRDAPQVPAQLSLGVVNSRRSLHARETRLSRWRGSRSTALPLPPTPPHRASRARRGEPAARSAARLNRSGLGETVEKVLPLHFADLVHGLLDPLGIGVPERLELGLIKIGEILTQVGERGRERRAVRGLLDGGAQRRDD